MFSILPQSGDRNRPVTGWPEAVVTLTVIGVFAAFVLAGLLPASAMALSLAIQLRQPPRGPDALEA
jgi:hypothetical protein